MCSWMAGLPSKDGVAGRERVMGAGPKALPVTEGASAFPLGGWDDTGRTEGESNVKSLSYHSEH